MYVIWRGGVDANTRFYTINPITDYVPQAVTVEEWDPPGCLCSVMHIKHLNFAGICRP